MWHKRLIVVASLTKLLKEDSTIVWGLFLAIGLALMPMGANAAPVVQAGSNLLTNPGFEQPFVQVNPTALMAPGWTPWWIPRPDG